MRIAVKSLIIGLLAWSIGGQVVAQEIAVDASFKLFEVSNGGLLIWDSDMEVWLMETSYSRIKLKGTVDPSYLEPGIAVQMTAKIDRLGKLDADINDLDISFSKDFFLGIFDQAGKRMPKFQDGTFLIRGRVFSRRNGELVLAVGGGLKIKGRLAKNGTIGIVPDELRIDDLPLLRLTDHGPVDSGFLKRGDGFEVKGSRLPNDTPRGAVNIPGRLTAREVTITVAKPLTAPENPRRKGAK